MHILHRHFSCTTTFTLRLFTWRLKWVCMCLHNDTDMLLRNWLLQHAYYRPHTALHGQLLWGWNLLLWRHCLFLSQIWEKKSCFTLSGIWNPDFIESEVREALRTEPKSCFVVSLVLLCISGALGNVTWFLSLHESFSLSWIGTVVFVTVRVGKRKVNGKED